MASKNVLVTPGRSSPEMVTSSVCAVRSGTSPHYRRRSGAPAGVSPCDQVADRAEVVMGASDADGEQPRAHGIQGLCAGGVVGDLLGEAARFGRDAGGPLDLGGVAAELGAPVVEDGVLVGDGLGSAEAVPDGRVLGDDLERLA